VMVPQTQQCIDCDKAIGGKDKMDTKPKAAGGRPRGINQSRELTRRGFPNLLSYAWWWDSSCSVKQMFL
jgi:hypothetical protein